MSHGEGPAEMNNYLVMMEQTKNRQEWARVTFLRMNNMNNMNDMNRHFETEVYIPNIRNAQRAVFGRQSNLPTRPINYVGMHDEERNKEVRAEVTNERVDLKNLDRNGDAYYIITLENNFFQGLR